MCALLAAVPAALADTDRTAIRHYVFFGRDRERISERSFLETNAFEGAQIRYSWKQLEHGEDAYDFSDIQHDLAFLGSHGKKLFVQIQDISYDQSIMPLPQYLLNNPAYHGGAERQFRIPGDDEKHATPGGWVARRWDPAVQGRFAALLRALADSLDGRIEALVLCETAVEFGSGPRDWPQGFTPDVYRDAIRTQLAAARAAFRRSRVIQYANFMPGEWLPADDHGYLRGVYACAESIGVGVGGPDLRPFRPQLRRHSYPLIAARSAGVPAGLAVQDDNLADRDPATGAPVTVPALVAFARDSLRLDYVFWGQQEPYYSRDVLPWLRAHPAGEGPR